EEAIISNNLNFFKSVTSEASFEFRKLAYHIAILHRRNKIVAFLEKEYNICLNFDETYDLLCKSIKIFSLESLKILCASMSWDNISNKEDLIHAGLKLSKKYNFNAGISFFNTMHLHKAISPVSNSLRLNKKSKSSMF